MNSSKGRERNRGVSVSGTGPIIILCRLLPNGEWKLCREANLVVNLSSVRGDKAGQNGRLLPSFVADLVKT